MATSLASVWDVRIVGIQSAGAIQRRQRARLAADGNRYLKLPFNRRGAA